MHCGIAMRLKLVLGIVFGLVVGTVFGQQDSVVLDTLTITTTRFSKYNSGAKIRRLSIADADGNLNNAMAHLPSISFKNYGNYGLSSIAFRGTSASHTQLIWNGIPVNSPTLGQADFSLFPTYLMDEIDVQYGSTSALTGSGAIGGAISMNNAVPVFAKQFKMNIAMKRASFGHYFGGVKVVYGNKLLQVKTKIYKRSIENHFSYPQKGSGDIVIQNNAAVQSHGAEQQLHFKLTSSQKLSLIGFYNLNEREIQPSIASVNDEKSIENNDSRIVLSYVNNSNIGFWNVKMAYALNDELYNKTDRVKSKQWSGLLDWDKAIGNKTSLRGGVNHHYFIPVTDNYGVEAKENRTDIYASVKQNIVENWVVSLNLRQSLYDDKVVPFTPSIGQEYDISLGKSKILLKNRLGRGYRIPTLNDRFWVQGGNPGLLPEDSWSAELGGQWIKKWQQNTITLETTYYHQNVNNWIQWIPVAGIWQPENIQRVLIDGIEAASDLSLKTGENTFNVLLNYSFTQSLITEDATIAYIDNQLPYIPIHTANAKIEWNFGSWSSAIKGNYMGKRYIEKSNDEFQAIPQNVLMDYVLSKSFQSKKIEVKLNVEVNNLMDVYYEQLKNHAMPGRNYAINLTINI